MIRSILGQFLMEKQAKVLPVNKVGWMKDAILKKTRYDKPMVTVKQPVVFKLNKQKLSVFIGLHTGMLF